MGVVLFLFLYMLTNGCNGANVEGDNDPLEGGNRVFYGFNNLLDKAFIEPVAELYMDHTPEPIRSGISNFFDNLAYPGVIINNILQGKIKDGFKGTGRFLVNSTIGIIGLFDPATHMGLQRQEEDFGQTLGAWGAGEGAYLVVPVIGPSSVRDAPGLVMELFTNLLYYVESSVMIPLIVVDTIDRRADLLRITRLRDRSPLDPYLFTRDTYRQRRAYLIHDGKSLYEYDDEAFQ